MESLDCLMDIERFAELVNSNKARIINIFSKSSHDHWGRVEAVPSAENLKLIKDEFNVEFEYISIADLLLCVNMAKDHNRGNTDVKSKPITSTGKKVLILFLLGRQVEKETLVVRKDNKEESDLYKYLKDKLNSDAKKFSYIPGRTVSYTQLCKLSQRYSNHITEVGILGGIKDLVKRNLVEECDKEKKLYKLSFAGCKKFLEENTFTE